MTARYPSAARAPRPTILLPEDPIITLAKAIARILAREHHEAAEAAKKAGEPPAHDS